MEKTWLGRLNQQHGYQEVELPHQSFSSVVTHQAQTDSQLDENNAIDIAVSVS